MLHRTRALLATLALLIVSSSAHAGNDVTIKPDVVYGHKFGLAMTMDVYQPKKANGAGVLFMVSGGWFSRWAPPERRQPLFQPLLDKGYTVFSVRHGSSPKFTLTEIVDDVRRSVRFVRLNAKKFHVDPDRLGVYGGSAGGHLSLMLGTASDNGMADAKDKLLRQSTRVAAVVALFPPTDLRGIVWQKKGNEDNKVYRRFPALNMTVATAGKYSPLLHVSNDDPPTLLIHGDKDRLVPLKHSHDIQKAFQKHNVVHELMVIKGAGHGFRGNDAARVSAALVAWFERHLAKKWALANGRAAQEHSSALINANLLILEISGD